ncbi:PTS system mannose/fructose/sorbose family transporter subunit IID [Citrobacter freundii]|nr:PTS system mannose/fructose/sorbose family transporter subunit IID [Citrobacter freundii]
MMKSDTTTAETQGRLDRRTLRRVNLRWLFTSAICWNYERMMSTGYLYAMLPASQKLYGDDPAALKKNLEMHAQFFNTSPHTGALILGVDLALEEEKGRDAMEAVSGLKTGLMGPFAAIGDALFGALVPTIFGSVGSWMALNGNPMGSIFWIIAHILIIFGFRLPQLGFAYRQGINMVGSMNTRLKSITEAATLLGVTVVGALIASVVHVTVPLTLKSGGVELKIQETLDQLMPSLLPVLLVALVYWLLGLRRMNSTRVIWVVMLISIVGYNTGILG